jgi:hypothetical protein
MKKILIFGFLILLGIGCSLSAPETGAPLSATLTPTITLTPTPSPAEILSKAGDAMQEMNTARFTLLREGNPIVLEAATGMSFNAASGEYQAPDRVHAVVKVGLMGSILEIEVYWLPEGVYISNPLTKKFEAVTGGLGFDGAAIFKPDGMPGVLNKRGIQNPSRIGNETIEDVETIHISGEADGAVLAPLTAGALQAGTMYPVDVWVDQSTFIPVRFHIVEPDGSGWVIDLYDINAEIEIDLP